MNGIWAPLAPLLAAALAAQVATSASAGELRVPSEFSTIAAAFEAAGVGDTVLVAPGTYTNCDGGPCLQLVATLKAGVSLISEGGADVTTLRVDTGAVGPNVLRGVGEGPEPIIVQGFTITASAPGYGGLAVIDCSETHIEECRFVSIEPGWDVGAGVWGDEGILEIRDCEFMRCSATQVGAAVFSLGNDVLVEGCRFQDNAAGAVYLSGRFSQDNAIVRDCEFLGNSDESALVAVHYRTLEIRGNRFVQNVASLDAAAVTINEVVLGGLLAGNLFWANRGTTHNAGTVSWNASGSILGNTFVGNESVSTWILRDATQGGDETEAKNNIFANNTGAPAYAAGLTVPTVSCNLFWNNAAGDYSGLYEPAPTDVFADPLFCDPENGDFTVQTDSPCLPANSNGCGLIGAFPEGCGAVSIEPESWGRVKERYRQEGDHE